MPGDPSPAIRPCSELRVFSTRIDDTIHSPRLYTFPSWRFPHSQTGTGLDGTFSQGCGGKPCPQLGLQTRWQLLHTGRERGQRPPVTRPPQPVVLSLHRPGKFSAYLSVLNIREFEGTVNLILSDPPNIDWQDSKQFLFTLSVQLCMNEKF